MTFDAASSIADVTETPSGSKQDFEAMGYHADNSSGEAASSGTLACVGGENAQTTHPYAAFSLVLLIKVVQDSQNHVRGDYWPPCPDVFCFCTTA